MPSAPGVGRRVVEGRVWRGWGGVEVERLEGMGWRWRGWRGVRGWQVGLRVNGNNIRGYFTVR